MKRLNLLYDRSLEDIMAKNKVTIKDVAKAAGVSTATVSYVINNRTDIKLTDETRKKVLQVIHLLDYSPNQSAKALAANRKSLLAVSFSASDSVLKCAEQMHTLQLLSKYFHGKNYELIMLSPSYTEKCDQADAIICYDMKLEQFRQLGDSNFIPLVALDCLVNDPLFFQVNTNLHILKEKADTHFGDKPYRYVMLDTPNAEKLSRLLSVFPDLIRIDSLTQIKELTGQHLLVSDLTLFKLLSDTNDVCFLPSVSGEKLDLLHQCIEAALERTPIEQHDLLI